jgi:hypothetical protein
MKRLVLLLLFSSAVSAGAAPLTRLPAEFRVDGIYLPVSINGGAPVPMKLCVGLDQTQLAGAGNTSVTAKLGVGRLAAQAIVVKVKALPSDLAGRLGEDVLGDRILVIRSREHAVYVTDPITPAVPAPMVASR